jgi:glycine/D-amino acid oxidase-like deaminating enzyme
VATSELPVRPFWVTAPDAPGAQATRPTPAGIDPTLPPHAEIAVLGAGIAGCVASLGLARAGARVVVLDSRRPGEGATGRSAGFLIRGTADHPIHVAAALGETRTLELWQYTAASLDALMALVDSEGMSCGLRRSGGLVLALDADEARDLEASARLVGGIGAPGELWSTAEVGQRTGFAGFTAGWFRPDDAMVDPARLCGALAAAAVRAGACILPGVTVSHVEDPPRGSLRIHTDRGVLPADRALLAVNSALGRLVPTLADVVTPVRAQMHVTAPDPRGVSLSWPVYAHHGYEYWRQEPTGELLFGGARWAEPAAERGVIDDARVSEVVYAAQRDFVRRHLPALATLAPAARWTGIMAYTPDGLPLVGALPGRDRQWVCAGWNGHGLALAPRSATLLSEVLLGRRAAAEVPGMFAPGRFTANPAR